MNSWVGLFSRTVGEASHEVFEGNCLRSPQLAAQYANAFSRSNSHFHSFFSFHYVYASLIFCRLRHFGFDSFYDDGLSPPRSSAPQAFSRLHRSFVFPYEVLFPANCERQMGPLIKPLISILARCYTDPSENCLSQV